MNPLAAINEFASEQERRIRQNRWKPFQTRRKADAAAKKLRCPLGQGSVHGYSYHGCRCEVCVAAKRAATQKEYRARAAARKAMAVSKGDGFHHMTYQAAFAVRRQEGVREC